MSPPLLPSTFKQVLETHETGLFQPSCSQSNRHKQGFSITTRKISYSLIEPEVLTYVPACSSFIYSFFCAQPLDQELWSSLIYFFYLHTRRFNQHIWFSFIYFFFCARPFDQKLWSSFIYLFYLHTTIRPRIMVLIDLFLLFAHYHSTKIYSLHSFISVIYTQPFSQNMWSSFIYSFFCIRPFDQNIWSSFIYSFFGGRPFDQKLGFSFIHFFLFLHDHSTKIYGPFSFIISFVRDHLTKN